MHYANNEDIRRNARQSTPARAYPRRNTTTLLAVGAALAAAAYVVRQRTREVESDNPPAGKFVEVDGIRLHYVERGTGQPVVLLHGDGSMIQDYDISGVMDLAAQKYRVIAFDRPGYGYSDRPRTTIWTPQAQATLLHHALEQIGVSQPIVVGHSWGALVAVALGLDYPDDVKSLVLISGYYYPTARLDVPLLSPPAIPIIGDLMRYTVSPLIGRLIWPMMKKRLFAPAQVPHKFDARFPVWMNLRPSQMRATAAEAALMIPAAFALRHRYHELTMPVVIMSGDGDRHVDRRVQSEQLHRELPHSTYHLTQGAGHMVHHMAPDEVMSCIDEAATALGAEHRGEARHIFPAPAQAI
ncbi:alpha/beta hydrolase [Noviherbaspirillum sp.]|uniref:alpha/beta fold hydrolase n=1 Tax=Noviherbaspirillum sp. TaxID=1926288 RepID=UPI002D5E1A5F|nr:alpha/beta hydrolase [Noviherbaspirillum sp.]HZW21606.1 alpha/beta hydrolase [Noviherbaspirillum sp.]